jgi:hypothetical protein
VCRCTTRPLLEGAEGALTLLSRRRALNGVALVGVDGTTAI